LPLLVVLACACFVASMSIRILDPIIPQVARDLGSTPETIALLATAFAVPFAISQPLFGPLGDTVGKARIIKVCLAIMFVSLVLSAVAISTEMMFASRILAGAAGGGLIPVSLAIVGDRFDMEHRQVALSRVLGVMLTAVVIGAVGSGIIASLAGWRAVFGLTAILCGAALLTALIGLKPRADRQPQRFNLERIVTSYGNVFRNPRAKLCYIAVCVEGVIIFGFLPYIAILLEERGAGGIREAGFVLAGMGIGGILYTIAVPWLLRWLRNMFHLMRLGGIVAAIGFLGVLLGGPWWVEAGAFVLIGLGFYSVHNSLQTQATELAPENRGSALSLHAFFFFIGHATGPMIYGVALHSIGPTPTLAAIVIAVPILAFVLADAFTRSGAH
jgi:MFS transporter, DHA1 family, inner membrane transport protein